jgi:hypothetical protein
MAVHFDLSIEILRTNKVRLTVTNSPAGTAVTEIDSPFSYDELVEISDKLGGRAGLTAEALTSERQEVGHQLYKAFFTEEIRYAYTTSAGRTKNGAADLLIRLTLGKAGDLAGLPWELLRDPTAGKLNVAVLDAPPPAKPVGGLRESVKGGRLIALIAALIVVVAGAAVILTAVRQPPRDVDLVLTGLRFFPPRPAPGEIFKVTITIKNNGTTASGAFNWAWFRGDFSEATNPDLSGIVPNLEPGDSITVRGEFSFGWWDEYSSTAWVNPDNRVPDKNPFNNLSKPASGFIRAADKDFTINFAYLPNGEPLQEVRDFKGDEFKAWNLELRPETSANPTCQAAVIKLIIADDENAITTGLGGNQAACRDLPIRASLDRPVGGVKVEFDAPAGQYMLELKDSANNLIGNLPLTFAEGGFHSIQLPTPDSTALSKDKGVVTMILRGGTISMKKLIFMQPS